MRLTGLDVGENQARRLLNDMDAYRAGQEAGCFVRHAASQPRSPSGRSLAGSERNRTEY